MTNLTHIPHTTSNSLTLTPEHPPPADPSVQLMHALTAPFSDGDDSTIDAVTAQLAGALKTGGDQSDLLKKQALVLDALFHRLLGKSTATLSSTDTHKGYVNQDMLTLALRSQRECRHTVNTLSAVERRKFLTLLTNELKDNKNVF